MTANTKRDELYTVSHAPVSRFQDNVIHGVDNIRGMTLGSQTTSTDNVFGASSAIQESIEQTFGKDEHTESGDNCREPSYAEIHSQQVSYIYAGDEFKTASLPKYIKTKMRNS